MCAKQGTSDRLTLVAEMDTKEFFTEYGEANRYTIKEVIGKGSYGVVCSAVDIKTGEKVAIKKINNVFDHVSDATRILREIKLLRLLRHPGSLASRRSAHMLLHLATMLLHRQQKLEQTFVYRYCGDQTYHAAA